MGRGTTLFVKAIGAFVLLAVVMAVVAMIVSMVMSIVATVVVAFVMMGVVALFVLAAVGLGSVLLNRDRKTESEMTASETVPGHSSTRENDRDPEERLRDRYVAGEIDDAEFERQLERLLEGPDIEPRIDTHPERLRHRE